MNLQGGRSASTEASSAPPRSVKRDPLNDSPHAKRKPISGTRERIKWQGVEDQRRDRSGCWQQKGNRGLESEPAGATEAGWVRVREALPESSGPPCNGLSERW